MEYSDGKTPTRKEYICNLEDKIKVPQFLKDMEGIIRPGEEYNPIEAFEVVKEVFIQNM